MIARNEEVPGGSAALYFGGRRPGPSRSRRVFSDRGQLYRYELRATFVTSLGGTSGTAWIDPVLSVDPTFELAPGVLAADYYRVEVAANVIQSIPEPAPLGVLWLGAAGLLRARRPSRRTAR